ncbi:MAG: transglutaminase-like domain-containing protein [Ignavibacteria bacterium]|nr:transglutaminase-like domain-containing protein [Ignavibacteria bacterium]
MTDESQIPYLIRLLDDDTPSVRASVMRTLASFGPSLDDALERHGVVPDARQMHVLEPLLVEHRGSRLRQQWPDWHKESVDKARLEHALRILGEFQIGGARGGRLTGHLDSLAEGFRAWFPGGGVLDLSHFLFDVAGLRGASTEYYHPLNSSIVHVIEHRRGIPISLVIIYILVGHRLGLRVEGCNFPGHFLAIAYDEARRVIVDCFNGGRVLGDRDIAILPGTRDDILGLEVRADGIIARVMRNLLNSYRKGEQSSTVILLEDLLNHIPGDR